MEKIDLKQFEKNIIPGYGKKIFEEEKLTTWFCCLSIRIGTHK